jgi:hypothetical protein
MIKEKTARTQRFHWQSRQDLYDYFRAIYRLSPAEVDAEVGGVLPHFKPRKGQAIKTQELWEKTGMSLIKKLGPPPLRQNRARAETQMNMPIVLREPIAGSGHQQAESLRKKSYDFEVDIP